MSGRPNDEWLKTMLKKHGSQEAVTAIMQKIGAKGGSTPTNKKKGMAADPVRASVAGKKGGQRSRKGHKFLREEGEFNVYLRHSDGEIVKKRIHA